MSVAKLILLIMLGLCLPVLIGHAAVLKMGQRGPAVLELQENLALLGYFQAAPTGYFGTITRDAVIAFQDESSLKSDGVVGDDTQAAIDRALATLFQLSSRGDDPISLLSWQVVNTLWTVRQTARVIDVDTGMAFNVRRLGGRLHADVEPSTRGDTRIMKTIYGGSWSWARRAILVELGGRYIAASMNGMPHGVQSIFDNDFPGQFCIHFFHSHLHVTGREDPEHQAMVLKAVRSGLAVTSRPAAGDEESEEAPKSTAGWTISPHNLQNFQ